MTSLGFFDGFTGRGVRVAIIDSGVNPNHPHVLGVAGGVGFNAEGETGDFLDYAGHGTAVAGAIRERAPNASLYALKVFDQSLRTNAAIIMQALKWAIDQQMHVINLSLGTTNSDHRAGFNRLVQAALEKQIVMVSARSIGDLDSLPGALPGVVSVMVDWQCSRDRYRCELRDKGPVFFGAGYPRAIPGLKEEQNLQGDSFAVAHIAGFVARAREAYPSKSVPELQKRMIEECSDSNGS
jgi:hypothetical protein